MEVKKYEVLKSNDGKGWVDKGLDDLGLTPEEEDLIVKFIKTLCDR